MRAAQRLDAAHPGRDAALGDDFEQADVAAARDMRAAAQLKRFPHANGAHARVVFLAEQRLRTVGLGRVQIHNRRFGRRVGADGAVDLLLDGRQLRLLERRGVGEIEAQSLRLN